MRSGANMTKIYVDVQSVQFVGIVSLVIFLLSIFYIPNGFGQVLNLSEIKSYAREHSPVLKAKEQEIGIQEGERVITRSSMFPTLSARGGYTHYKLEHGTIEGVFGPKQKPDVDRFAGDVSFNFVAFAFGKNFFNYKGASLLVQSKKKEYERTWQMLSFNLSKVYYSLLTVDKTILATKKTIESLKALKSEISQKVKVGRLAEVDLLKVDVNLYKTIDDLSKLQTLREDLLGELKRLMGYREDDFKFDDVPIAKIERKHFDLSELLSTAYESRADLNSIVRAIEGVGYQVKSVKASYFPEVTLRGAYAQQAPGDRNFVSDGNAGVYISMPIFDGLYRKGKTDKLSSERSRLEYMLADKKLEIKKEVRTALENYNETLIRVDATKRSMEHAREVLRIEKLKYKLGRTTINFVLDAEGALLGARSLYYKAYYDNLLALDDIKLAVGNLN